MEPLAPDLSVPYAISVFGAGLETGEVDRMVMGSVSVQDELFGDSIYLARVRHFLSGLSVFSVGGSGGGNSDLSYAVVNGGVCSPGDSKRISGIIFPGE